MLMKKNNNPYNIKPNILRRLKSDSVDIDTRAKIIQKLLNQNINRNNNEIIAVYEHFTTNATFNDIKNYTHFVLMVKIFTDKAVVVITFCPYTYKLSHINFPDEAYKNFGAYQDAISEVIGLMPIVKKVISFFEFLEHK